MPIWIGFRHLLSPESIILHTDFLKKETPKMHRVLNLQSMKANAPQLDVIDQSTISRMCSVGPECCITSNITNPAVNF